MQETTGEPEIVSDDVARVKAVELFRCDPDNAQRLAGDDEHAREDVGIGLKPLAPQAFTDDRRARRYYAQ